MGGQAGSQSAGPLCVYCGMAVIIPDSHYQVVVHYSDAAVTDGESLVILGFEAPALQDAEVAVEFALAYQAADLMQIQPQGVILSQVDVITENTKIEAPASIDGESSSPRLPPNCALLVEKVTSRRGRRARGRNFWPLAMFESQVSPTGSLDPSGIQELFDDFFTELTTRGLAPVILQGDTGVTPPLSPPPNVTRFVVDPVIGTQRRRMRR